MPITCRNILPRWQGAITLPQGGAAVYLKGSGRLQRQRSISKATVYLKDNGLSQRQRSASKAAVYLKGNGRLQRQWPASKAAVCFKGNGLSQRQWSISKAAVYLKGNGLLQRQWRVHFKRLLRQIAAEGHHLNICATTKLLIRHSRVLAHRERQGSLNSPFRSHHAPWSHPCVFIKIGFRINAVGVSPSYSGKVFYHMRAFQQFVSS